jgi:hypothetical protein
MGFQTRIEPELEKVLFIGRGELGDTVMAQSHRQARIDNVLSDRPAWCWNRSSHPGAVGVGEVCA